jgi:hypothetical protein
MKKTLLSSLLAIFVLTFFVMTSCNKDTGTNELTNPIVSGATLSVNQVLPDNLMPYFDAHNVNVSGSLETPIMNSSPDFCGDTTRGGPPPPPCGGGPSGPPMDNQGGFEFRGILMQLKLTKDEFPVVQKVLWNYQQCVQLVLSKTFAARKEIMYAAMLSQKTIMNTYMTALKAAGKDTAAIHAARAAAMTAMKALNDDTKAKLDALIDKTALCDCWTKMITDFEAALTTDQVTLFKTWLAKQKTPCDAAVSPSVKP